MRHSPPSKARFFFTTAPLPCPYFPERIERRVVTELLGRDANTLHDVLTHAGFRRSHGIAYAPSCPDCDACVAVRIPVDDFRLSKSQRRILNRNDGLSATTLEARASGVRGGVEERLHAVGAEAHHELPLQKREQKQTEEEEVRDARPCREDHEHPQHADEHGGG